MNFANATYRGKKGKANKRGGADENPALSAAATASPPAPATADGVGNLERDQLVQVKKAMEMLQLQQGSAPIRSTDEAMKKTYEFWSTQPVPKIDEEVSTSANECINAELSVAQIRVDPYTLPQGFEWDTLNLDDPLVVRPFFNLLLPPDLANQVFLDSF